MTPILAGLLPLFITLGLALIALAALGVFSLVMLIRQARGDFETEDTEED